MSAAWERYAADFNAMSDEEVEQERAQAQSLVDEQESWLEAVASWEAAGKPRAIKRPAFVAWKGAGFADGEIIEVREPDGREHPMKVGSLQFRAALRDLGQNMPVRLATDEQRQQWQPRPSVPDFSHHRSE